MLFLERMTCRIIRGLKNCHLWQRQRTVTAAALILLVAFTVSMLLGLWRDRLLYAAFYACCAPQLDVYNAAFKIPDFLFALLVTGSLSAAFIPVFSEFRTRSRRQAYALATSIAFLLGGLFCFAGLLIFIFARPLAEVVTPGFSDSQLRLMVYFIRWMLVGQAFFLFSSLTTSILQARKRFLFPALAPIFYNLSIIIAIIGWAPQLGISAPVFGVVIGAFLHWAIQLPALAKAGFHFVKPKRLWSKGIKKIVYLMIPRSLALALDESAATLAIFLASSLPAGSLSLFYLSQHLFAIPVRLFGITLGQAIFPSFSQLIARRRRRAFRERFLKAFHLVFYLTSFVTVMMLVLRLPLVRLLFGSRQFPWSATVTTGRLLAFLAPAILAQAGIQILVRVFYSFQDTKTTFLAALWALLVNIAISVPGVYVFGWGIYAIVAAISLASLFQFGILFTILMARLNHWQEEVRLNGTFFSRLLAINIVTGLTAWELMHFFDSFVFDTSRVFGLLLLTGFSFLGGLIVYLLLSWRLNIFSFFAPAWRRLLADKKLPF